MKPQSAPSFCVNKLKVLADTTRLAVLECLMAGPNHVGDLKAVLNIEQSLLSHHLALLREAGLVEATRDGKAVLYQLSPDVRGGLTDNVLDLGCCQLSFPHQSTFVKRPKS